MYSKRRFLQYFGRWLTLYFIPAGLPSLAYSAESNHTDPRPEFATNRVELILESAFGTSEAADDATILIETPLVSGSREVVPFRITVPDAEKLVVVSNSNAYPLLMFVDQIRQPTAVVSGRARLNQSGVITCYALRNGQIGRASRRIELSGHWESY